MKTDAEYRRETEFSHDAGGTKPLRLVVGIKPRKPITGLPPGRVKLRMRNKDFAMLYVKDSIGIRQFLIEDNGLTWAVSYEQGSNRKIGSQDRIH